VRSPAKAGEIASSLALSSNNLAADLFLQHSLGHDGGLLVETVEVANEAAGAVVMEVMASLPAP
jgi:hypothetical protein